MVDPSICSICGVSTDGIFAYCANCYHMKLIKATSQLVDLGTFAADFSAKIKDVNYAIETGDTSVLNKLEKAMDTWHELINHLPTVFLIEFAQILVELEKENNE